VPRCIPVVDSPGFACNGGDVTLVQDEHDATVTTPNVVVKCVGVIASRFGYPNDEALGADPLYPHGLKFYDVVEVLDSPWLHDINTRNRVAFPNFAGYQHRHFFMAFHDSSFEVLCRRLEFQTVEPEG
jgi:hypothetical protein